MFRTFNVVDDLKLNACSMKIYLWLAVECVFLALNLLVEWRDEIPSNPQR
ncbi:MAG: hypothetical protein U1B30_11775 [Pseudomonadota bacterium]|jgi:hypothetical protein|nr:hypothetical protein [Pseudomonadota bacterium]